MCENENTKIITYEIDSANDLLSSLLSTSDTDERRMLIDYLKQLAVNLPINHIYEKMAERPRDVSQESADMAALESMLDRVFES